MSMEHKPDRKRIDIIDAARGFSVILMVIHHALFDAVNFGAPSWLLVIRYDIHYLFAGSYLPVRRVVPLFQK